MPHEQDSSFKIIGSTPIPMAGQIHNQSSESTESEWIFRLLFLYIYKYRILSFYYMKKVYIFLIENWGGGVETLK